MGYELNSEIWQVALIFESGITSAIKHFNIATNQSLNQKVPMFLHRGFVFYRPPILYLLSSVRGKENSTGQYQKSQRVIFIPVESLHAFAKAGLTALFTNPFHHYLHMTGIISFR
jgi:hypothetical protein